ncbi:MAG TPA: hypothetical protein ENN12_04190 [Epsilonproteobacteria bacterium]|nr:hypothetical protein [Campylobacterota bacterium]
MSTKDELKPYNFGVIGEFEIYDSNTPMFASRLAALGCKVEIIQSHSDDYDKLKDTISDAI